jgi:hypothetical protein
MRRASEAPTKKPYQAPKLIVYGDLAELTNSRAITAKNRDMQGGGSVKT